jgi:catechol-2,3-dioxygenase
VTDVARSRAFYERLFGMTALWEPDPDNVYLTTGTDVLALHRDAAVGDARDPAQTLDHAGFLVAARELVDGAAAEAVALGYEVHHAPRLHRDGSYSCYLRDPDGVSVQVIHVPGL